MSDNIFSHYRPDRSIQITPEWSFIYIYFFAPHCCLCRNDSACDASWFVYWTCIGRIWNVYCIAFRMSFICIYTEVPQNSWWFYNVDLFSRQSLACTRSDGTFKPPHLLSLLIKAHTVKSFLDIFLYYDVPEIAAWATITTWYQCILD